MNSNLNNIYYGIGRRKEATARIYLKEGTGNIKVNEKELRNYFYMDSDYLEKIIYYPLQLLNKEKNYDILARVVGGGFNAQAESIRLAISRTLLKIFPEQRTLLKSFGLLARNEKHKERRKVGKVKARKSPPFVKR